MSRRTQLTISIAASLGFAVMAGCTTRPPFFPNADSNLRKSADDFSADAAGRHYETTAPRGGDAEARAEIDYGIDRLYLANTSSADWTNVELWLNKSYVIFIPSVPGKGAKALNINFASIFNSAGEHFPFKTTPFTGTQTPIDSIEIYRNGKMYIVTMALAD